MSRKGKTTCPICGGPAELVRYGTQLWIMCDDDPKHQTDAGDYGD